MRRFILRSLLVLTSAALALSASSAGKGHRPDPWITLTTKIVLLTTDDLDAHAINVDTVNGRVTLHGKVDSAPQKTRAAQVAGNVDGVLGVRNLLQVVPESARKITNLDDASLRERASEALKSDVALDDSHIAVKSVNKGVALLSGSAASLSDHLSAIRDVAGVDGIRRVASEVQSPDAISDREIVADEEKEHAAPSSEGGMKQTVADLWITTATKSRLMADGDTPAMDINVDTDNGVVTLFGVVPSELSKKAAEADALKVSGVKKVDNDLQIVPDKNKNVVAVRDDEALKTAEKALKGHDELKNVSVEVKNGVARLTGDVGSQADRIMAAVTVRSCEGIRSIENDTHVKKS